MKTLPKVAFDRRNRKIYFGGTCDEVRDVCEAMCCRLDWSISVLPEEAERAKLQVRALCFRTETACENVEVPCLHRDYVLGKKPDGTCLYLDRSNRCSIYEHRPKVCRDFSCAGGWNIERSVGSANPARFDGGGSDVQTRDYQRRVREYVSEKLSVDMKFMVDPRLELKAVIRLAERNEIALIAKTADECRFSSIKADFGFAEIDEGELLRLIGLFQNGATLAHVREGANEKRNSSLGEQELFDLVALLYVLGVLLFTPDSAHSAGSFRCPTQ